MLTAVTCSARKKMFFIVQVTKGYESRTKKMIVRFIFNLLLL